MNFNHPSFLVSHKCCCKCLCVRIAYVRLIQRWFTRIGFTWSPRLSRLVPKERIQADGESQSVQNLMFDRRNQCLQFLRLSANAVRTEISVTGNWTVQCDLLLAVGSIGHRQSFVATVCLSCGHIEDKVRVLQTVSGFIFRDHLMAILSSCIANAANLRIS